MHIRADMQIEGVPFLAFLLIIINLVEKSKKKWYNLIKRASTLRMAFLAYARGPKRGLCS